MDENGFVGSTAVGPTRQAELANPCLPPVMKIPIQPYVSNMIRVISHSSPNWHAAHLDLLRIRMVCTLVYLDGVMTELYNSAYELKAHSSLVNMQCFESTGGCNISGFTETHTMLLTEFITLQCCTYWRNAYPSVRPLIFYMSSLILPYSVLSQGILPLSLFVTLV